MKKNIIILSINLLLLTNLFSQKEPEATEVWSPEARIVTPAENNAPPSDAIVLFDGKNLKEWSSMKNNTTAEWKVADDCMTVVKGKGNIKTKREFGDIQLHLEWRTPTVIEDKGQGRGNSGVFFQERYEVQVLDNYENKTYSNGQAGSIYKQSIPLVNACKKPGEWQTYDIIFIAPKFNKDGIRVSPGFLTVIHNGILIQNHVEIKGTTEYIGQPKNVAHGKASIMLQDHSNPVSYRNIWVREL
ncbi:MAG: DUF1080 domain-containing protein [Saprospiraceae bacterium]